MPLRTTLPAARLTLLGLLVCGILASCSRTESLPRLRLATTTSTENSGLLDVLLPAFTEETGIGVDVLSMGTGKALRTGKQGDCDVVLVHAPQAENEFVLQGYGDERVRLMFNEFVLLGPPSDPAGVSGTTIPEALTAIAATPEASFCSRGDESGTHTKELELWRDAGVDLATCAFQYLEVGQGMGATLTQAHERAAYTLADRGTFLSYRGRLDLRVLVEGDVRLRNPYSAIAVSAQKHPHVQSENAHRLIDWLTGPEGQRRIGEYRIGDEVLFHPDAKR